MTHKFNEIDAANLLNSYYEIDSSLSKHCLFTFKPNPEYLHLPDLDKTIALLTIRVDAEDILEAIECYAYVLNRTKFPIYEEE